MKKTICLTALTVICLTIPSIVEADVSAEKVFIDPPEEISPGVGNKFAIEVSVEKAEGLFSFHFALSYNPEFLKFVSAIEGDFWKKTTEGWTFAVTTFYGKEMGDGGSGTLDMSVVQFESTGVNGSGVLAKVEFEVVKDVTKPIFLEFKKVDLSDDQGNKKTPEEVTGGKIIPSCCCISGKVSGNISGGVTIKLCGDKSDATNTDDSGNYIFSDLPNGTYTIVPREAGYLFEPPCQVVTISGSNVSGVDFTSSEGCLSADIDCDGCVSLGELIDYINLWAEDKVALSCVIDAINVWAGNIGSPGEASSTRSTPQSAKTGALVTVKLNLDVNETKKPSGIAIREQQIPSDWNVISSTPQAKFDSENREVTWILFGDDVTDQTLTYTVEVPAEAEITTEKITGQILYISEGQHVTVPIAETQITMTPPPLTLTDVLNCPNPFSDQTTFTYVLSREANVRIEIYDLAGQLVKEIKDASGYQGYNKEVWDGKGRNGEELANGVYLYRVVTSNGEERVSIINKLAILK